MRRSPRAWRTPRSRGRASAAAVSRPVKAPARGFGIRGTPPSSFDRLRIDWRAGAAGDDQRRAAEEKFVDAIGCAILGQLFEIKNLAHAQPHRGDHYPVPGLIGFRRFVRPYLDAPSIGTDRGDLLILAPVTVLKFYAGRIAACITAPLLFLQAAFHLAGAHDDEIAATDLDFLCFGAFRQSVWANAFSAAVA